MTSHPNTGRKAGRRAGRGRRASSSADIAAAKPEFDREIEVDTGADIAGDDTPTTLARDKSPPKQQAPPKSTTERDAYSIEEFCRRHNLGRSTFYNMRIAKKGPTELRILGRVLITKEAAAAWRREREQDQAQEVIEPAE